MGQPSAKAANILDRHMTNPFRVLDLPPDTPADRVERQGEMLLSMLALGVADASRYQTPLGPEERTAEKVREAMAELRDPNRRLVHEWWMREERGSANV